MGEVQCEQADPARNRRARILPSEAPRDHEMKHEEELAIELDRDALAQPMQIEHVVADHRIERRRNRAQQEWRGEADADHLPANDPWSQRVEVEQDIGQLRHR
jgi:hypothetical protein